MGSMVARLQYGGCTMDSLHAKTGSMVARLQYGGCTMDSLHAKGVGCGYTSYVLYRRIFVANENFFHLYIF